MQYSLELYLLLRVTDFNSVYTEGNCKTWAAAKGGA